MSGRLVILPKKSWNVWNIENREKVLRDEREHREQLQAAADKTNKLIQEQTLNVLRSETFDSDQVTPFRLFADIEAKVEEDNTNAEYMKEKRHKEQLAKKREGVADWSFGDGSYEVKKLRPWYEAANPDLSKVPAPEVSADVAARELERKAVADPMAQYVPKPKDHSSDKADSMSKVRSIADKISSEIDKNGSTSNEKDKLHKKEKKKDKKHHKGDKYEKDEKNHKKSHHHDKEFEELQKQAELDSILQELRRRGLDSLASQNSSSSSSMKIASSASKVEEEVKGNDVVDSRRYSQQYNPQIAKYRKTSIE